MSLAFKGAIPTSANDHRSSFRRAGGPPYRRGNESVLYVPTLYSEPE